MPLPHPARPRQPPALLRTLPDAPVSPSGLVPALDLSRSWHLQTNVHGELEGGFDWCWRWLRPEEAE